MITQTILAGIRTVTAESRRGFGIMVPAMQKASDPIQQLFVDKLREYKSKSKNDSFVDATPQIQKELQSELDRVAKQYGGASGTEMSKFPDFKFEDPKLEPISIESTK